jgi:hypothetical protein
VDPLKRKIVEETAIAHAKAFFRSGRWIRRRFS